MEACHASVAGSIPAGRSKINATVLELVDGLGLDPSVRKGVRVRVSPVVPIFS